MEPAQNNKPIIFFDGVCGLCSGFVDFIMKVDPNGTHLFSPLQGETAKKLLTENEINDLDSVILYQNSKKLKKSEAVLQVFANLGGAWSVFKLFKGLPRVFSDTVYDLVARYRYKIFGKKETCRIPTPAERKRFLD